MQKFHPTTFRESEFFHNLRSVGTSAEDQFRFVLNKRESIFSMGSFRSSSFGILLIFPFSMLSLVQLRTNFKSS